MMNAFKLASLVLVFAASGCAHNRIVRDASTYVAEHVNALSRQENASEALKLAAAAARDADDPALCSRYAEPAFRIDHRAAAEAYRALWLAGLPYPQPDGSMPAEGQEQPDPGDPGPYMSGHADAFCGGD